MNFLVTTVINSTMVSPRSHLPITNVTSKLYPDRCALAEYVFYRGHSMNYQSARSKL